MLFFFFFFFALPLGIIGRLCSVIVAIPGHILYYFSWFSYINKEVH